MADCSKTAEISQKMSPDEGFVYDYGRTRHPEGGECVRERRQRWERLEDLLCEAGLFVAEVLALVAGFFYYAAIGVTLIAAFLFHHQSISIIRSIMLDVGTAMAWGLAHLVANALDARQRGRIPD